MKFLLDTNVLSELRKRQANPDVARWVHAQPVADLAISAVSILEVELGVIRKERIDPAQGRRLRVWLETSVLPGFSGRILAFDVTAAREAAPLHVPDPAPERDALIAGTALAHSLVLVTRNECDFKRFGARLLNPWLG